MYFDSKFAILSSLPIIWHSTAHLQYNKIQTVFPLFLHRYIRATKDVKNHSRPDEAG